MAGTENLAFDFQDHHFVVLPPRKWRDSAFAALHAGQFRVWASKVLVDGTFESGWLELDPTMDEIGEFVKAWQASAGESLGKSSRSATSSRSTRKR
jgi:hypothetical protein